MKLNEYQELSKRTIDTKKDSLEMLKESLIGLSEEVGELQSMYKKALFHGHPLVKQEAEKELGDILWYLTAICALGGYSLEEVAKANIEKLKKRYPEGFSNEASINRECEHEWVYNIVTAHRIPIFNKECKKCGKKE